MTSLKPAAISRIEPYLDDTTKADIDVVLNRAPDKFEVEAARGTGLVLVEHVESVMVQISTDKVHHYVVSLEQKLHEISVEGGNIRQRYEAAVNSIKDQAAKLNWP